MNSTLSIQKLENNLSKVSQNRNLIFGIMLFTAWVAFEVFNFSTTEFALLDVLGDVTFASIKWATILSLAFCGIDLAGVAKLFSQGNTKEEPMEVWYLFGSWVLAAGMNATLTWWGISIAISNHVSQGSVLFAGDTVQKVAPVFVAIMVWLIRIMIIGSFNSTGEKLFSSNNNTPAAPRRSSNLGYNNAAHNTGYSASAANKPMMRTTQPVKPDYKPFTRTSDSKYDQFSNNTPLN